MPTTAQDIQDLNFIPEDVISKKRSKRTQSSLAKVGFGFIIFTIIVSAGVLVYSIFQSQKLNKIDRQIQEQVAVINQYSSFGESAYFLALKLEKIAQVINSRQLNSLLMDEIRSRTPVEVSLANYNIQSNNVIDISAKATGNYAPIAYFRENLISKNNEKGYFSDAQIGSATLNSNENSVNFSLKVIFNGDSFKDEIEK